MKSIGTSLAVFVATVVLFVSGCTDTPPPAPPQDLGNATVTRYVAVGQSFTAGFQSNGLYESAQVYSFPNLIAQQLRAAGANIGTFEQPLWSDPGTPAPGGLASRYEILNLTGPVIGPRGLPAGHPTTLLWPAPYNNLGIPRSFVYDFLNAVDSNSCFSAVFAATPNPLFNSTLRGIGSQFAQTRALNPDLVTFWHGIDDVLGFATSGGTKPTAPTPLGLFTNLYGQALDSLRTALPNAKIVVANIPDVTVLPFFTTLGPEIGALLPPGVFMRYQTHGNTGPAFDSTRFTEATPPLITLTGVAYVPLIGDTTGRWYTDNHYPAIPAGINTHMPFGLHPLNPWPDALVLDPAEQSDARAAVANFNSVIATAAAAHHAAIVDINSFVNRLVRGYVVAGQGYSTSFIAGAFFSLDGVHACSRGQALIANEFIKVMNASFGMHLSPIDASTAPGISPP